VPGHKTRTREGKEEGKRGKERRGGEEGKGRKRRAMDVTGR